MSFVRLFLILTNIFALIHSESIPDCENLINFIESSKIEFYDVECCQSYFVECDESQSYIIGLDLSKILNSETKENFSLQTFLNQFSYLNKLIIRDNELTGDLIIPENSNIKYLDVSHNQLTGNLIIPGKSNLETLYINNNKFTGDINITENSKLKYLYAENNHFDGKLIFHKNFKLVEINVGNNKLKGDLIIPENKNLENLNAEYNSFNGKLIIQENASIKNLEAYNNLLSGDLEISESSNLEYLNISENKFNGHLNIPRNPKLKTLHVDNNNFTGDIVIPENSNLESLYAYNNNFNGKIIIPKNSKLNTLYIARNFITGSVIIPENSELKILDISHNFLTGNITIPENSELMELNISYNQLKGELIIPESKSLTSLDISYNQFTGDLNIPEYSNLNSLYASGNQLTGDINIQENSNLINLDVSYNQFSGNIYISENSNLISLNVSGNQFTKLNVLEKSNLLDLYASNNKLTGDLKISENLINLDVSNNQFTGDLDISNNSGLIELNISGNQFTGELNISKNILLKNLYADANKFNSISCSTQSFLWNLSIAYNQLNNDAIEELLKLKNLKYLDISYNNMTDVLYTPENVKYLNACGNKFNSISLGFNKHLTELDISSNQFYNDALEELTKLEHLEYLNISNNNMDGILYIPETIVTLEASGNKFNSISCSIFTNLAFLDLSFNQLNNDVFEIISKFENLESLEIANNNMDDILYIPTTATLLNAKGNKFKSISCSNNTPLHILDISNNLLDNDIFETLSRFEELEMLNLSGNNLTSLPSTLFKLYNLRILDLENIPQLNAKIINFENSPIESCYFRGTSISCYQKDTCLSVDTDKDIEFYEECSNEDINTILYNNSEEEKTYEDVDKVDKYSLLNDCKQINNFFNKNELSNCCHVAGIKCDANNNIIELNLNYENKSFTGNFDFNKFPLFQNLRILKFRNFEMKSLPSRLFELPNLKSLFIWNANLTTIPKIDIKENSIENLDLYDNSISEFPYELSKLNNLKYLSLGKNKISKELTDDFLEFSSLNYLKINDNNLTGKLIIPYGIEVISAQNNNFSSLDSRGSNNYLKKLYLENNSFEERVFNDLQNFKKLQWLYLNKNTKIKSIPPIIENLKNIEIINLQETGIEELPNNFFKLSKIRRLYLRSNSKKFKIINFANSPIDYCFFDDTQLLCMESRTCENIKKYSFPECSENTINDIKNSKTTINDNSIKDNDKNKEDNKKNKDDIEKIVYSRDCEKLNDFLHFSSNKNCCTLEYVTCHEDYSIKKLQLKMNDEKINYNIFPNLEKLEELEIISANINTLPSALFYLPNLQNLSINKSNIIEITDDISNMSLLENINLSDNNIKKFPYQFKIISSLKILNLMNNNITEELTDEIESFSSLENIILDNNHITGELHIPKSLIKISANNNKFTSIPIKNTDYCLEKMELQGNNFNGDIFNSLTQFKELNFLDLSYNKKIKSIPQSIEKLDKLNRLFLKETNLKELPYGIFKLSNLKGFYLESSSSIFKIINFGNKSIECSFFETPILCYQPDSCNNIDNNLYRNCTMEEISEVKSKLSIENTKKNDISEDCKKFNTFVNKTLNSDCCEEFGISCDENDFIKKLYINNDQDSIVQYHFDNLYDIDFDIFPNLTHIEKLEIINIKLKSIPNSIFQLPLKILTLNRNNLMGELPNEFKNLKNIQEINLNENKFSGELYIPKSLKFLFAENNNFNLISNTKMNDSLEKLYLPGNNFNGNIFNELGHYKNLKELNLNNNRKIEYIPSTIKDLSKLENLMIDGTSIKKFPNGVFLLPNLNEINIGSKNNIGAKIVHFCKSKITCNFNNISLLCYEPESCYNINIANTIKPCTYEEIRKILPNRSKHYCNINDVNDDKESNINTDPYNENIEDGMTFKFGIENNIMNGIVIVAGNMNDNDMINEIDNSLINNEDDNYININYNRYKNKNNDYRNKIKNEKDSKKNKEKDKDKPKHKNRIKNKTNEDDKVYFIYLVLSLIGINGTIITILFIVCLLSYSKSKNKIDYHNNENIDSDIIISEKIIIYNKEDIQNEEKILSKKNENKENYLIEEIKMKKDINLKEIKKKKMRKIIY